MRTRHAIAASLFCCFATFAVAQADSPSDAQRKALWKKADAAHYSLLNGGLASFTCDADMEWDPMFKELKLEANDPVRAVLKQVKLHIVYDDQGAVDITHNELASSDADVAERATKALAGVERSLRGFYQTWSFFGVATPLPDINSDYRFDPIPTGYVLSYREGEANIQTTLTESFAVTEVNYDSAAFKVVMHPNWMQTPRGLLLSSYEGDTDVPNQGKAHISLKVDYQTVAGLPMPAKVTESVPLPSGTIDMIYDFSNYQVKKK